MSQVDTERATALRTNPWYNTVQDDGSLEPITSVTSVREEIQAHMESIVRDFPITPGIAHSYDRVVVHQYTDKSGYLEQGRVVRDVLLRHAVTGQWFSFELHVCTTDIPDGSEYEEAMGG